MSAKEEEVETMGQRLSRLRRQAGLSQLELAKKSKVPIGTIRNWEQDRRVPSLDTAARVATALGVTLDEVAGLPGRAEATTRTPAAKPAAASRKKGK
jgi:transcriptional regulator with XRE-family HTH domain